MGIDPGVSFSGFALLCSRKNQPCHPQDFLLEDAGVLKTDSQLSFSQRVGSLHRTIYNLIEETKPTTVVMENTFIGLNPQSALKLGQIRGAYISAAARLHIATAEVAPTHVKKIITGSGRATKESVALAIKSLLGFDRGRLPFDTTDAIAIGLSWGMQLGLRSKYDPITNKPSKPIAMLKTCPILNPAITKPS